MSDGIIRSLERPHQGTALHPGGQIQWVGTALSTDTTTGIFGRDSGKSASALFLTEEESSLCEDGYYAAGYIAQSHAKVEERYEEWLARWSSIKIPGGASLVLDHKNKDQLRYVKCRPWGRNRHGWWVRFWSGDPGSVDGIRGERLNRIILDEANLYLTKKAVAAIWPMGNSRQAKKYIVSTPSKKGIGYATLKDFYDRGKKGLPGFASFNAPSECAYWNDPDWIRENNKLRAAQGLALKDPDYLLHQRMAMRDPAHPNEKTPEEMEEFDGIFTTDLGALFLNLDKVISLPVLRREDADLRDEDSGLWVGKDPEDFHQYLIGQDWGLVDDRSISFVVDRITKNMVALRVEPLERHGGRYDKFLTNLHALHLRYNKATIIGDGSGVGNYIGRTLLAGRYQTYYQDVRLAYGGEHDKGKYVTRMRKLFQDVGWRMMEVPILRKQFAEFTSKPMGGANGLQYSAPDGSNDDVVMAALYASIRVELAQTGPLGPQAEEPDPFSYEGILKSVQRAGRRERPYVIGSRKPR